jgi:Ion channel
MDARSAGYGVVLVLVIASIGVQMILVGSDVTRFLTVALQAATLVAAVRVSGVQRTRLRVAAFAAVCAVVASLLVWVIRGDFPIVVSAIVNGLLVAVAPAALARGLVDQLRERGGVTIATLTGVLAIYLLIGMFFSFLYGVIGAVDSPALFAQPVDATRADELYFSFVTMCTVGYGDLTPAADLTRATAVAQMLIGQIYLVTIVSLIVANLGRRREAA